MIEGTWWQTTHIWVIIYWLTIFYMFALSLYLPEKTHYSKRYGYVKVVKVL